MQAERLLGPQMIDVDGNTEDRSDTVSVFNGPKMDWLQTIPLRNWIPRNAQRLRKSPANSCLA